MKKRLFSLLLALCLLISMVPAQANAAEIIASGSINGFTWVLDEAGTLILSGSGYFSTPWHDSHQNSPWYSHRHDVRKLMLGEGITGLDSAFLSELEKLEDISIPSTLTDITASTFSGCRNLSFLTVDFENPVYCDWDSVLFSKDMSELIFYPHGLQGSYTIPNDVTTIGPGAFENAQDLTSITFTSSIVEICDSAFRGCTGLTSVTLPLNLREIGYAAFENSGLKSVTIPAGTQVIGDYAFDGCQSLSKLLVTKGSSHFSSDNIALFNKDQTVLLQYPAGRSGSYSMPDTVQSFTRHAFWFNKNLTGLELSDGLLSIPNDAFAGCSGLSTLEIPPYVQTVGRDLFTAGSEPAKLYFLGSAPQTPNGAPFGKSSASGETNPVTMTVYRPENDMTWTSAVQTSFGGKIAWKLCENLSPFYDVPTNSWYFQPVEWAVVNGYMNGMSNTMFGPSTSLNRAMMVTILYRIAGSPSVGNTRNPFTDVPADHFYTEPVVWAVTTGITTGTDSTHFSPNQPCNRAQVVTFLHRFFGSPSVGNTHNPFTDVPENSWFRDPVLWAVENGITNGLSPTQFGPNTICNRAQLVTFLYRACS